MLSIIEVTCPHCGARGQLMLPPLGSVIVGPCPSCHEIVAVFCGRALPLQRDLMTGDDRDRKRDHLLDVLTRYLDKRLDQVIDKLPVDFDVDAPLSSAVETPLGDESILSQAETSQEISDDEIDTFRNSELNRLDNPEYFREIFG